MKITNKYGGIGNKEKVKVFLKHLKERFYLTLNGKKLAMLNNG